MRGSPMLSSQCYLYEFMSPLEKELNQFVTDI